MKRIITIILAAAFILSMAACGGGDDNNDKPISDNDTPTTQGETTPTTTLDATSTEPEIQELALGEMATTDKVEFTLDYAQLAIAIDTDTWMPQEYTPDVKGYIAPKGVTFIALGYTVKNVDRTSLDLEPGSMTGIAISAKYNDESYALRKPSIPNNGYSGSEIRYLAQSENDEAWQTIVTGSETNYGKYVLSVGQKMSYKCYANIPVDAESLTDAFEIRVGLTSSAEGVPFIYAINP